CFKRPFNSSIKPLIPIPKSTTKAMDKDQLKVFIDFITKGFKNVAKELKSSSSGGSTGHGSTPKESNIIPVKPFFGNDDEDLGDWIRSFEIAAEANNLTNDRKLKIVPGYLQGLAAYWFEENTDNITRWNATGYANSSFVPCFLKKFSTEEKQNMWHHQLNEL
ncbi:13147_t:CDS:1, partial [Funneliformis geosporum]